ncbi:MAG: bi-domain-containing oxidoreductase [Prolixibacteraceae bacterium]|jgi:predicted dehydrogenase/threonine dehydrogenase-like Zn-dependent dehydrogenase|nr:bi-domain-containing oxidoreductase [Prolixibacteraceae bacterium]
MLQAIVKKGKVLSTEIPAPLVRKGGVLIRVVNSCISAGTEISSVDITKKSLIQLALDQPENIKIGMDMIRAQGIKKTLDRINGQRDGGKPTGYSVSGIVIGIGEGVSKFKTGDKVTAAGAGLANHAEFVDVPELLVTPMPKGLDFKEASTVTLGAIAMQGVRRADLKFGEFAVVVGAGILGLLTVQMLTNSGVRVIAVDLDQKRLELAKEFGAELIINPKSDNQVKLITNYTNGYGTDAVIFTAATSSSKPLSEAFQSCKRKGKVVLVGVSGMEINRSDMYQKELDFLVSTSYGPGRYDADYEENGNDYPYAYVRWTENRNMGEYLRLLATGKIQITKMINSTFKIEDVENAFEALEKPEKPLMVLLDYGLPELNNLDALFSHERKVLINDKPVTKERIGVALVGAGNFAIGMHLPNLKSLNKEYELIAVMNRTGHKAQATAKQFGAKYATTDYDVVLNDNEVDLVMICTRHDSHASMALKALEKGKHVFVEKPLAITSEELKPIEDFYNSEKKNKPVLMVGFNRRFSKYAQEIKKHTDKRINPLFIHYRMNAGFIPNDSWVHQDGGRIIGEGCHLIDLMTFFTGGEIESISHEELTPTTDYFSSSDNKSIVLKYKDGSVCTIHYFANGNKQMPKEYMEVHFDEKTIVMEDYKSLKGLGIKVKNISTSTSQKGQFEELKELQKCLVSSNEKWPIELWDLVQTTKIAFNL